MFWTLILVEDDLCKVAYSVHFHYMASLFFGT